LKVGWRDESVAEQLLHICTLFRSGFTKTKRRAEKSGEKNKEKRRVERREKSMHGQ
jgi:hypothetical protein